MKDWGESVSELMIEKKNSYKKLYTVLSYLGVFTFCTCCILICLLVFLLVLSCVVCNCFWLAVCIFVVVLCIVVILCVFAVLCVYCCFYFRCRTAG